MGKIAHGLFHKSLLAIAVLLLIVLLNTQVASAPLGPYTWTVETVDFGGDVGQYTSIAVDQASGDVHISYYDYTSNDLKYAKWVSPGPWNIQTVDPTGGRWTSLKLLSGDPHIAYYDTTNGWLKYATSTGGNPPWTIETVDSAGIRGPFASLAFDSSGIPHISYYDFWYGVWFATRTGGATPWTTVLAVPPPNILYQVGRYTSLVFDINDNPHISYYDDVTDDLMHAWKIGSGPWSTETVDWVGDVGWHGTSIAMDPSGYLHISYYDATNGNLKYATKIGSNPWTTETENYDQLDDVGWDSSLAFLGSDPCISYCDNTHYDLKFAWKDPTTGWQAQTVDSGGNVGEYTSLAFDPSGYPHISYYDATWGDLKHAYVGPSIPPPVPEMPFGVDVAFIMAFTALAVYLKFKRFHPNLQLQ